MAVSVAGTQRFRTLAPVKRSHESQTRPRTAPLRLPALLTLPSHQSPSARVPAVFAILCADPASPWQTLPPARPKDLDRKSTRLNSSHVAISYAVFCLKKKKKHII